ncbi:MAG: adenylyltransferase/cytidyltransferase family protein [Lachnospiraceae bacterium]|nr:adenylyltransferase/cytidyltransferase family protein [Lachnospiraceae bacterium]
MLYLKKNELTVINLENDEENVSMKVLQKVLVECPSNMIYCEALGKLVGIISIGDILRAHRRGLNQVQVNKEFIYLDTEEYMKARNIFKEKKNVNALPVVTRNHILIGDYTRWDDLMVLEYKLRTARWADLIDNEKHVALVKPGNIFVQRKSIFEKMKKYLKMQGFVASCIEHSEVSDYMESFDIILFVDENEIRACKAALALMSDEHRNAVNQLKTYKDIVDIKVSNKKHVSYLKDLHNKGINFIGLICKKNNTPYYKQLLSQIYDKFAAVGEVPCNKLPKSMYKEFFDDLYSEEYAEKIWNTSAFKVENRGGILRLKDRHSELYNFVNGERYTTEQPENFMKTIYFFGACYIVGRLSDDSHTIESSLQKRLCDNDLNIRVVNCGCIGTDFRNSLARIAVTHLRKGDIVVIDQPPIGVDCINYIDLNKVLEENNVDAAWLADSGLHCNHKVYKLYADAIYEAFASTLLTEIDELGELVKKDENYIKYLYLDQYFPHFDHSQYKKVGSIVMNCNPFTYGHRYLIEWALKTVDFLIIFVVEEDKSIFSFAERFIMVCEGVADLENVSVVPSGPFILSRMSFPEYFIKETSEDIVEHTEQDITTFAEKIASQLGIQYRFVGEEPEDKVTNQYNLAMKKILSKYGMELIEIPRKRIDGQYISASLVRRYMEENNVEMLKELLPETTREIIFGSQM